MTWLSKNQCQALRERNFKSENGIVDEMGNDVFTDKEWKNIKTNNKLLQFSDKINCFFASTLMCSLGISRNFIEHVNISRILMKFVKRFRKTVRRYGQI